MRVLSSLLLVLAVAAPVRADLVPPPTEPLHALPGLRLSASVGLAFAGSGRVIFEDEPAGTGGVYESTSGLAVGVEARGGWVHTSGAGAELRIGVTGLSLLERARQAFAPGGEVEPARLVEVGGVFSFGRALVRPRASTELRLEGGLGWARVLSSHASGLTLHVGFQVAVFFAPRIALTFGVGGRWIEIGEPEDVTGGEVYARIGPTVRFP